MGLENANNELKAEKDRLVTKNKELELKMEFILEENERLKAIISSMESQQQHLQWLQKYSLQIGRNVRVRNSSKFLGLHGINCFILLLYRVVAGPISGNVFF